jgi:hypothetical protein
MVSEIVELSVSNNVQRRCNLNAKSLVNRGKSSVRSQVR